MSSYDRGPYVAEALSTAHQQLLHHARQRDNWLRTYLIAQALLLLLTLGIDAGPVEGARLVSDALVLSCPIALVFISLYAAEDRLVVSNHLYLKRLPSLEARVSGSSTTMHNVESGIHSYQAGHGLRVLAQAVAFVALPGGLTSLHFVTVAQWGWLYYAEVAVGTAAFLGSLVVLVGTVRYHAVSTRDPIEDAPTS